MTKWLHYTPGQRSAKSPAESPVVCLSHPTLGAVCLTRGAFLWLGAERPFLSPTHYKWHKKEITTSQCFRKRRPEFTCAKLDISPNFSPYPLCRRRAPENSWGPRLLAPVGLLLFSAALLSQQREWLFKAKNAEWGDTVERFSISSFLPG